MATPHVLRKNFAGFTGRDLRSSDLTREINAAIEFKNCDLTKDLSIVTRKGGKERSPSGPYLGLYNYTYTDANGAVVERMLSLDSKLWKRRDSTLTITYIGASTSMRASFADRLSSGPAHVFTLEDSGSPSFEWQYFGAPTAYADTVDNLRAAIDALADFTCTLSGSTSVLMSSLPIFFDQPIAAGGGTLVITFWEWEAVNHTYGGTDPFATYYAARGNTEFEIASGANIGNEFFLATGYEYLHVYDGQTVYRAGVPQPTAGPTLSAPYNSATGAIPALASGRSYIYTYRQKGNQGNITEGIESAIATSAAVVAPNDTIDVTLTNLVAGSGFNTNCATVNGNQVGVTTITVNNSPHTLQVGDTAYFLDRSTGAYVERAITARAATTITIAGANVNVNNGDVISNNLRISIYANVAGGSLFYLVDEIPNNSLAATQVYVDIKADTALTAQYLVPDRPHNILATKPRYLTVHQQQLVVAGAPTEPNVVRFSDLLGGTQVFPTDSNFITAPATIQGGISGVFSSQGNLIIGKENAIYSVSGDLNLLTLRIDKITEGGIGIACHNTCRDTPRGTIFLSRVGFYILVNGFQLGEVGAAINKVFTDFYSAEADRWQIKRSFAYNVERQEKYICFVPKESGSGTGKYANPNSEAHVFDYYHSLWANYTGWNMGGGITVYDDELYWLTRQDDSVLTVTGKLWKQHGLGRLDDYHDMRNKIYSEFSPGWDSLGEPSVDKLPLRMKIYALLQDGVATLTYLELTSYLNYSPGPHTQLAKALGEATSSSGYGVPAYGLSPYGSPTVIETIVKLRSGKAKAIRFSFVNDQFLSRLVLTGYEVEFAGPYGPTLRK